MFRNGFLYCFFKLSKLTTSKVAPRLEEVQRFQKKPDAEDDFLSDQDEWDFLDERTLFKTIRDDGQHLFEVGDRVVVDNSSIRNIKAIITQLDFQDFVRVRTIENVPLELKIKTCDISKFFETGEAVRVMQGTHAGETGLVVAIDGKHAVVSMDAATGAEELKILLSNLQAKKENTEHIKLRDYIRKSVLEIKYQAGDLVQFSSREQVGLVIHVYPDYLRVVTASNTVENVKQSAVNKKIFHK